MQYHVKSVSHHDHDKPRVHNVFYLWVAFHVADLDCVVHKWQKDMVPVVHPMIINIANIMQH